VYWKNFVSLGSWNLLWVAIAASLLLGLRPSNTHKSSQAKRVALCFILIFVATQAFIFGFTNQGTWADTYTAINRLPLHFVPALLFSAVIVLKGALPQIVTSGSGAPPRFAASLAVSLLAAMIVTAGAVSHLSRDLPGQPGPTLDHPATGLSFAFGSGFPADDRMLVDGFNNGYALLSSGPVSITASSKRILRYTWLPPEPSMEAAFFWRRSDDARNVQRAEITLPGTHLIDLETESDWRGEIIEFGFLIAGDNGDTIEIGETSLIPDSLSSRLMLTWHAWTSFEGWTQKSINFLYGGDYRQLLSLPMLVTFWLLTALLLLWLLARFRTGFSGRQFLNFAGLLFLIGWVLLDIRWSANSVRQVQLSSQSQWQMKARDRPGTELDGALYDYVQKLKSEVLSDQPARILILGDENSDEYYQLKAKYHLLPHSAFVSGGIPQRLKSESLNYVLFFGPPGGIRKTPGWNPAWQNHLTRVDSDEWGTVYRIR
jgi:hypothetical protein